VALGLGLFPENNTQSTAQSPTPIDSHEPASADSIGAGDLIDLYVPYCPDLTRSFRIASDGSLFLPLLQSRLSVSGLTPGELSQRISAALKNQKILVDPVVNVSIVEYRSHTVSVIGAVNHPNTFQAIGRTTLIDALARAEGLSPSAGASIIITSMRERSSTQRSTVTRIMVSDLFDGRVPEANMRLYGGEEIRVTECKKIFVAGNVRHPGMYPMQSDSDTTVVKALALSSGLDSYSKSVAYVYRKTDTGSQRQEIRIPLKEILHRRAPDVPLMADDILYVPTSDGKRLTAKVINQIAGFGQTAEAGLLVTR